MIINSNAELWVYLFPLKLIFQIRRILKFDWKVLIKILIRLSWMSYVSDEGVLTSAEPSHDDPAGVSGAGRLLVPGDREVWPGCSAQVLTDISQETECFWYLIYFSYLYKCNTDFLINQLPWLYRLGWVWATEKSIHEYFHIYRKSPNNIFRLPPRIRAICHNLLKTVEEYDAELSALQRPQGEEGDIFHYNAIWSAFQLWSISCQRTRERNQIMFFSGLNSIMRCKWISWNFF